MKLVLPICNKRPERAPKIFGKTFILCWRCTMSFVGVILTATTLEVGRIKVAISVPSLLFVILLMIPMIVDGGRQQWGRGYTSTNFKRALTGLLFGTALTIACNAIFK